MSEKDTVERLLTQDPFKSLLEKLSTKEITDFAITYRTINGTFVVDWLGDALRLVTLTELLYDDIKDTITNSIVEEE